MERASSKTTQHGYRLVTPVGGTLTARGGEVLIVDDPIKASDASSEVEAGGCEGVVRLHRLSGDCHERDGAAGPPGRLAPPGFAPSFAVGRRLQFRRSASVYASAHGSFSVQDLPQRRFRAFVDALGR